MFVVLCGCAVLFVAAMLVLLRSVWLLRLCGCRRLLGSLHGFVYNWYVPVEEVGVSVMLEC